MHNKIDNGFSSTKGLIEESTIERIFNRYNYTEETRAIIENEHLLSPGILNRLNNAYPKHSGILETAEFLFTTQHHYNGISGFRKIVEMLHNHGIELGHLKERELFINVYRFMATKHVLNTINWKNFENDSVFQLVFPQPGMIKADVAEAYLKATSEEERGKIVNDYIKETNPHDGKQKLNKPWFRNENGEIEIIEGSQHKYPECQLIFDVTTQNCFAFCNYCFRHAQLRGDEDMFIQNDISQIHKYLRIHKEVTDVLITGGDAAYITHERFEEYINPIIEDPRLSHIKTIRLGTRVLTFHPELILTKKFNNMLDSFQKLNDNGIQLVFMSHFSTPREILNPSTVAAIKRLRSRGVVVKSQSPIMNHISLFQKENGDVDIERSAQNWIDLGNILAMLSVGFHSIYCARPTGEHHYFTAPLADINKIFYKVYGSLASINRPSRFITMTSSAGKISLLGTVEVNGETVFALKFNEGRKMEWMDRIYLAKYDENETTIEKLKPYQSEKHFYEDELIEIENNLDNAINLSTQSSEFENSNQNAEVNKLSND